MLNLLLLLAPVMDETYDFSNYCGVGEGSNDFSLFSNIKSFVVFLYNPSFFADIKF